MHDPSASESASACRGLPTGMLPFSHCWFSAKGNYWTLWLLCSTHCEGREFLVTASAPDSCLRSERTEINISPVGEPNSEAMSRSSISLESGSPIRVRIQSTVQMRSESNEVECCSSHLFLVEVRTPHRTFNYPYSRTRLGKALCSLTPKAYPTPRMRFRSWENIGRKSLYHPTQERRIALKVFDMLKSTPFERHRWLMNGPVDHS